MNAPEVTDHLVNAIKSGKHDVIICNYANCDMVGHTGDYDAAVKAVSAVDECLGKVVAKIEEMGGKAIITADHGNAEEMVDYVNGGAFTAHTINKVPCIIVGEGNVELREDGKLCDLAPTILKMMEVEQPSEMTVTSLF